MYSRTSNNISEYHDCSWKGDFVGASRWLLGASFRDYVADDPLIDCI